MLSLTLQCLCSVLNCLFAGAALGIARHRRALTPDRRAGWLLAGVGFGLLGASGAAQDAAAVTAFVSGAGTPAYDAYLRWAPALNYSRVGAGIAFAASLAWVAWSGRFPQRRRWAEMCGVMLAGLLAGGVAGVWEGSFDMGAHGFASSVAITVEFIAFAAALLVAATRGNLDVFLFSALMLSAANMALNVPLLSAMSLVSTLGGGRPPPWLLPLQSAVCAGMMLGVALLRLELLRRGLRVSDVLGRGPRRRLRFLDVAVDPAGADDAGGARSRGSRAAP